MRVTIRGPKPEDCEAFAAAVRRSAEQISPWNPVDPAALPVLLRMQGPHLRTFLIEDVATGGLVGICNVANIIMSPLCSAALGYSSYLPFTGTGRMTEGLRLAVDRCFAHPREGGLGLHRVEINVNPDNTRSIAMAERLGFRHEGFSPRLLFFNGAWRDHERYALTTEEWQPPTPPAPAGAGGAVSSR